LLGSAADGSSQTFRPAARFEEQSPEAGFTPLNRASSFGTSRSEDGFAVAYNLPGDQGRPPGWLAEASANVASRGFLFGNQSDLMQL
jgi:hypothetical protein